MPSKFWVSHSKLSLYAVCPRAYYFAYVYRNSKSGKKVRHITPSLALGQTVHNVLEELSRAPRNIRFREPLIAKFENNWKKITGIKGGFDNEAHESKYKKRGEEMMGRVYANRSVLEGLAVKIQAENNLPKFDLVPEEQIVLCGKIDWLSFNENSRSVHIIDFKTGKYEERETSLQLLIYFLLAKNCQQYPVDGASYWYLDRNDAPRQEALPLYDDALQEVIIASKRLHLAEKLKKFDCPGNGCRDCAPYSRIANGEGELVGIDDFGSEVYYLPQKLEDAIDVVVH